MLAPRFIPFVTKHIVRHRIRSLLTIGGVATAMFLFCAVRAMQDGVHEATTANAGETSLIVYRENRYCPFSSKLPQDYSRKIEKIPGVESAIPMKILVGNCRQGRSRQHEPGQQSCPHPHHTQSNPHGARMARPRMRFASLSLTNSSLLESKVTSRPRSIAMLAR